MKRLPDLVIIVDTYRETTAVKEANKLKIPILAVVDTNSDPDYIDYIIPGNDDAMRSIKLLVSTFADACIEGRNIRQSGGDIDVEDADGNVNYDAYSDFDEEDGDEQFLGESTLAKLRDTNLFDEEEEDEE